VHFDTDAEELLAGALANRRQSATSLANVSAPKRVTPR
jgi:hypothetical protein